MLSVVAQCNILLHCVYIFLLMSDSLIEETIEQLRAINLKLDLFLNFNSLSVNNALVISNLVVLILILLVLFGLLALNLNSLRCRGFVRLEAEPRLSLVTSEEEGEELRS